MESELIWVGIALLCFLVGYRTGEYYPRKIDEDEIFANAYRKGRAANPRSCGFCGGTGYNTDESPCDNCFGIGFDVEPTESSEEGNDDSR